MSPEPLPRPAPKPALQQRVAEAILAGAADVLAAGGEDTSMTAVAAASGVARATVYRYFPNREALLAALADLAVTRAEGALVAARLEEVPPREGVRRTVRALVEVGDPFVAVARSRAPLEAEGFDRRLGAPLRRMFERGQTLGAIRADIPGEWLTQSLLGLIASVVAARPALGREDTIALIVDLFLDGAATPT